MPPINYASQARQLVAEGLPIGPRMHPCVCRAGRHAHAGGNATGGCKETGCKRYRANLAYQLAYDAIDAQAMSLRDVFREAGKIEGAKRRAANPVTPGTWRIGVSDLDSCPKKIEYRNVPPEGFTPAPEDKREAEMGTAIHEYTEQRMRMVFPWRLFEQPLKVPGLDRESRYDWYDPITCELGDIKTAGDWRWDQLADNGPTEDTWDKVMVYALALRAAGVEVRTVRLDYIKRCNGHDEHFIREYDETKARAALDRLLGYATLLDLGIELPKTGTGPTNDPLCRRCFARFDCWNVPAAERAGRSPESFTILGAEPLDESIVWAISEKVAASADRLAAQKREDVAKTLLDGVDPGRYGEYEGYERKSSSSGGVDWKGYAETLGEKFDLPDEMRPKIEDIKVPRRQDSTYVAWGKVRKATLDREKKNRAALDQAATEQNDEVA